MFVRYSKYYTDSIILNTVTTDELPCPTLPLTYFLTPWSRGLHEKLTDSRLVKKFPAFYGTQRYITTFASACHLFLSWSRSIWSMPPHSISWRSIL